MPGLVTPRARLRSQLTRGASASTRIEKCVPGRAITRERPTLFFTVPTLYARMLEVPDAERRFDLSSLRFCVSSGEALPPAIFDAWADRFGLELLVFTWPALATRILRVSAQVYNRAADYERLAEALGILRREAA